MANPRTRGAAPTPAPAAAAATAAALSAPVYCHSPTVRALALPCRILDAACCSARTPEPTSSLHRMDSLRRHGAHAGCQRPL
eukprot:1158380-Lingulodinium_polyedra.AAC.1